MDNKTIGFAQKIVSELENIYQKLSTLHEYLQSQRETVSNTKSATTTQNQDEAQHSVNRSIAEPNQPPSIGEHQTSKEHRKVGLKWPTFAVQVLALLGLVAYTVETRRTNDLTGMIFNASKESNRTDQRAWVGMLTVGEALYKDSWMALITPPADINISPNDIHPAYVKEHFPIKLSVLIANFGKTPALNAKTLVSYRFLRADSVFTPDYGGAEPNGLTIMFPQMHLMLAPSAERIANHGDIVSIESGTYVLYLFGKITYDDIFKSPHDSPHESTFCVALASNREAFSSTSACDPYNTTK